MTPTGSWTFDIARRPGECNAEIGWCDEHDYPALRYEDGSVACWWECIVLSRCEYPEKFVPLRVERLGEEQ